MTKIILAEMHALGFTFNGIHRFDEDDNDSNYFKWYIMMIILILLIMKIHPYLIW